MKELVLLIISIFINCNSINNSSSYSYILVDENEYIIDSEISDELDAIFLLGMDYNDSDVELFCNEVACLIENKFRRWDNFLINNPNMMGWKETHYLIAKMRYTPLIFESFDYEKFKEMSSGEFIKEIKIISKNYNEVYPDEDTTVYYRYKIIKHYW